MTYYRFPGYVPRKYKKKLVKVEKTDKDKSPLTSVMYIYLEPHLAVYCKTEGMSEFGSTSAFINYLIAKDCKDEASIERMKKISAKRFGLVKEED